FFSSRRRHTRFSRDWSSDVCSSDLELTHIISKKYPHVKIIALTNFTSALYVNTMLSSGAKGYLLKTTEEPTLVEAIETVYKGGEIGRASCRERVERREVAFTGREQE